MLHFSTVFTKKHISGCPQIEVMADLYYFWGQISPQSLAKPKPTTKKISLILLSDLIKNSIYEPVSYFTQLNIY